MWGAMLTRYLAAVGIVTVQYDCLLTIKDEVKHSLLESPGIPPTVYCTFRFVSFGQDPLTSQNACILLIDIYPPP